MPEQKTEWLEAQCPICGVKYKYLIAYKPATCGKYGCVRKQLHPELRHRRG